MSSNENPHVPVDGFDVWWRANQPNEIHLVTSTDKFHDGKGERPGLWVSFSCNPKSANYNPANFNRCARLLGESGLPAPAQVPEHNRLLKRRGKLISEWEKQHDTDTDTDTNTNTHGDDGFGPVLVPA